MEGEHSYVGLEESAKVLWHESVGHLRHRKSVIQIMWLDYSEQEKRITKMRSERLKFA